MKIALHSVSYGGVWPGQAVVPLERVVEKAARFGVEGVMLMAKRPHLSVLDATPRRIEELKAALGRAGVAAACIAGYTDIGAGWDFPDNPYAEKEVLYIDHLARTAKALGAGVVRVFTAFERPGDPPDRLHERVLRVLREAAQRAGEYGVVLGVQNHHDHCVHYKSLRDLIDEIGLPNCRACFDAWAPFQHGDDPAAAAKFMAPITAFTTTADYQVRRRFAYQPPLVAYEPRTPYYQMVPLGEGEIDYRAFLAGLKAGGYDGWVGFEMCAPFVCGGSEESLDAVAAESIAALRGMIRGL
jgi:sugar phosphate isomerase/epimerase